MSKSNLLQYLETYNSKSTTHIAEYSIGLFFQILLLSQGTITKIFCRMTKN